MSLPDAAPNDCPQPPGFRTSLSMLILHEACQTAGGDGAAPEEVYEACVRIVLLHEPQR
jgi:hypothetical protein